MTLATDLLLDIATEKNGYTIGEPWRFSEFSLAAIVPILRVTSARRPYRLLTEVGDDILIKDTGDISKVEITNRGRSPILLKAGEIVTGATQSRTLVSSQVVIVGEKVVADCVCVHSTQGIRAGQTVRHGGYSPISVRSAVSKGFYRAGPMASYQYSRSLQHDVWAGVKSHSRGLAESATSYMAAASSGRLGDLPVPDTTSWAAPAEDLARRVQESQEKFEAVLKAVPKLENQVGLCLIALNGFESLEAFDHPGGWEALRDSILKSEAGKIADVSDEDSIFQFRADKAKATIRELLATSQFEEAIAVDKPDTQTFLLQSQRITGEVVSLYGVPIHCTFMRKV